MISRLTRRLGNLFSKQSIQLNPIGQGDIGFIDVGSVGGLPEPWNKYTNEIKFLLNFEPNDLPIRSPHSLTYNTALWEIEGKFPFYVYKGFNATGSSLFKQNYSYVDEHWEELRARGPKSLAETWHARSELVRTESLYCRTLDNIFQEELPDQRFHFMKIDAQGAEGQILRGAEQFLKQGCVGLHLELFNVPLYEGIMLQDEIIAYLATLNFELIKKYPPHGSFDSQNDCVFLHHNRYGAIRNKILKIYSL